MAIAAILLAAGDTLVDGVPVPLLSWREDETLVEWQVAQLRAAGADVVVVVLGYEAERIIPLVARDNVEPIVNERWRDGVAGSLRVGAAAIPRESDAAIVARVDEPCAAEVYRRLLDGHAANGGLIARVSRGAPIVFGSMMLGELRSLRDGDELDGMLARHAREIADVVVSERELVRIKDAASYALSRGRAGVE